MNIIVTTSQKQDQELIDKAISVANFLNANYIPRKELLNLNDKSFTYLVVTKNGLNCHHQDQKLFYHPSMAMLRLKRIYKGEEDIFTTLCGNIKGLKVLDCTLGFGSDSLVFSYLVGSKGEVTSLEKSRLIYKIVKDGFTGNYPKWHEINRYTETIKTINIDYTSYLNKCSDKSYDIVYFDPMFDHPLEESVHLNPLRFFAEEKPLEMDTIKIAKRVAKRLIIVKNNKDYNFTKLGITKLFSKNASKVQYGVIEVGE